MTETPDPGQQLPPQPPPQPPYGGPPQQAYGAPPPYGSWAPQDHPRAMTSLILGIIGLIACQVISPFAWVMGKRAMDEIDANPQMYGGRSTAQAGWILGIIGTVLLILGVVAAVAVIAIAIVGVSASSP